MYFRNTISRVLVSSAVALVATTGLYAMPKGSCGQKGDACPVEPPPGPFAFAYPMDMGIACPRDFYVHADALAFQAKQDGMEFAMSLDDENNAYLLGFSGNRTDWHWNPGFRVGIGGYVDHDAWNIDLNWTWVNITDSQRVNVDGGVELAPLWIPTNMIPTGDVFNSAAGVWSSSYNTLDVRLGKPYHVSRYLTFNPHFGVRAGWMDQYYSAHYGGYNAAAPVDIIHHGENNFWGVGLRSGIDTDWSIGKSWCLFGNIAGSLLYGKFKVTQDLEPVAGPDFTEAAGGFYAENDFYQNVPNLEIAVGIGWGRYFSRNRYHLAARVAFELHEWFDQLNMRKYFVFDGFGADIFNNNSDTVSRGNLTLDGVSLRLQLDM